MVLLVGVRSAVAGVLFVYWAFLPSANLRIQKIGLRDCFFSGFKQNLMFSSQHGDIRV